MAIDLADRFETRDGSRPEPTPLVAAIGRELPLSAFAVLTVGDAFESHDSSARGREAARAYVNDRVSFTAPTESAVAERVVEELVRQLSGNAQLAARMSRTKPIAVDVVPGDGSLSALGYPRSASRNASGMFWDRADWQHARIAIRADRLDHEPGLVVHEMAHAIHYLGFTKDERDIIYRVLRPAFGSRAAMDEVFAIYSEREFLDAFSVDERRAPGVYGFTRRQWDENHVFTRFVRKLYWPGKRLAGPGISSPSGTDWMTGISRR